MILPLLSGPALVRRFAAAAQASATAALDFTVGSVFRALADANQSVALWLQYLLLLVLKTTRASTSEGADLDTWCADYPGLARLPAVAATGNVTLSRNSATQPALVVPGVQVKTIDGTQVFKVVADATNTAWSTSAGAVPGFYLAAGVSALMVPVQAAAPGTSGNIAAGTLTLIASNVPNIDAATNATGFTNGADAETDAALRARIGLFFRGLSSGTAAAIQFAALSVQQGVRMQLVVNSPRIGAYTLYADDGSGAAPAGFISAIAAAVQQVTGEGVSAYVLPPVDVPVSIVVSVSVAAGYVRADVDTAIVAAIGRMVASLGIGTPLAYLQLAAVVFGVPGVTGIATLTVNGGQVDASPGVGGLVTLPASPSVT